MDFDELVWQVFWFRLFCTSAFQKLFTEISVKTRCTETLTYFTFLVH